MLRVLIERPDFAGDSLARARAEFRAVARRHPEIASALGVGFFADEAEREAKLPKADILIAWRFPAAELARRAPRLKWIQLTGAGIEHLLPLDWLPAGVA